MGSAYSATITTTINDQAYDTKEIQKFTSICGATCTNTRHNDTVIISGTINGDANISQVCTGNAKCIVKQQLDALAQQVYSNSATTTNQSGLPKFLTLDASTVVNKTAVRNALEQYVDNTCKTNVHNLSTNSKFIVTADAKINGNLNIAQTGDAAAQCSMVTTAKLQAIADGNTSSATNNGSVSSGAATVYIVLGIAFLIIAAVAIYIFVKVYFGPELAALGSAGKVFGAGSSVNGGNTSALLSMMGSNNK